MQTPDSPSHPYFVRNYYHRIFLLQLLHAQTSVMVMEYLRRWILYIIPQWQG